MYIDFFFIQIYIHKENQDHTHESKWLILIGFHPENVCTRVHGENKEFMDPNSPPCHLGSKRSQW